MIVPDYILDYLKNTLTSNGKFYTKYAESLLTDEIDSWFKANKMDARYVVRFLNNIDELETKKCEWCKKEIDTYGMIKIPRFCCPECSKAYSSFASKEKWKTRDIAAILKKRKETNLKKYGVEFAQAAESVKVKQRQTCLDRYGVVSTALIREVKAKQIETLQKKYGDGITNPFGSKEIRTKIKETMIDRYGVENPLQSEEIKEKTKRTNLERYGVTNPSMLPEIRDKAKQTMLERYGAENPLQSEEIREKIKRTNLDRYGVEYTTQSTQMKEKTKQTMLEKYGVDNPSKVDVFQTKKTITHRQKVFETFIDRIKRLHNLEFVGTKDDYINSDTLTIRCGECGHTFQTTVTNAQKLFCPECARKPYSKKEKELVDYIKSCYDGEIILNSRKLLDGKEIDIFIPELNIGFEFNGTYWHSDWKISPTYHQEKTTLAKEKSIRLVHIFEYEWDFKQENVKALIRNVLGIHSHKVYARQCYVKEITSKEYTDFLNEYHFSGAIKSPIRYGLFYKDELVSVIGFGKSRFDNNETELHRYCVKDGWKIVGGFSKLIKHSNIKDFISYIDYAHFTGDGYKKIGFETIGYTKPNYVYVYGNSILTRYQCQKHKLKNILKDFDETLSETDNMFLNGYTKIFDCGNIKMKYSA